jgi:pentatricopeptide repeat protein
MCGASSTSVGSACERASAAVVVQNKPVIATALQQPPPPLQQSRQALPQDETTVATAIPVRQSLTQSEKRKFDYIFLEALKLKNADKLDAAYELFRRCLEIDSTSSVAYYELSYYFIQLNRPEKAIELMRKSIAYSPDNIEYHNILATLLFNMGMFGEAAEEYERLVSEAPEKLEHRYFLAEAYSRQGEVEKAIEVYDTMEDFMGVNEAVSMEKYQLYMSVNESDRAFEELKKLSDKYPLESRYKIIIGDLYLQQNDEKQALKYFSMARETDPETPYYPVSMANYYEKTGQSDSAKMQINNALLNPNLDVNTKLGILARYIVRLQRTAGDIEGANMLFHTLLEQHPDETRLKLAYGEFLASRNKYDEARFQYSLVTESEPENLDAWLQLLRLSLQSNDMDEVIRLCNKCRTIFPDTGEFPLYLGMAYAQKKEYSRAIETYSEAIPLIPPENQRLISDFYGQTGDVYFRMKQTDKAFEAYEEALKHNDKNVLVLNNYAYYLSLLKKELTKAERMSALCIKLEPDNATYIDTYAWVFFVRGNYSLAKIYIEQAIAKDRTRSAELLDHYGDILFLSGETEKAVEQWMKAKEAGKNSPTLNKKISEQKYYEETEDELFNDDEPSPPANNET